MSNTELTNVSQLYQDTSNIRGVYKKKARTVVEIKYNLRLTSTEMLSAGHNSRDADDIISERVAGLLQKDSFLKDGLDEQVRR